ncbi:hypothetical protein DFH09DRAFT_1402553 [Mycena vulgaris]|nr:hypothetical protein DFH09DRAFT_1402553 [Mycena vulgaris]
MRKSRGSVPSPAPAVPSAVPFRGQFSKPRDGAGTGRLHTEGWQAKWVSTPTLRVVRVGNLPPSATVEDLLNLVHFGPIERISFLPEKACIFLAFLEASTATKFFADARRPRLRLHGHWLTIGWGGPSAVPPEINQAVTTYGASRAVYLGALEESLTEVALHDELSKLAPIDKVKIVRDKNIGFVHFLSIGAATKVVKKLQSDPTWAGKRVKRISYGTDRCAHVNSQQAAAHQPQAPTAQSLMEPFASSTGAHSNRTVFLGNIHPGTSTADLCDVIRGGVLHNVLYKPDKGIAFVTFIDAAAASSFFQMSVTHGLTLNNRRLQVGWGKPSTPLPFRLESAVQGGATRSVYIGKVKDFELFSEERLMADFGQFGDIERVQHLKEKYAAFVNFTNIRNAIEAIEAIKDRPEYADLRISYGKDRCEGL